MPHLGDTLEDAILLAEAGRTGPAAAAFWRGRRRSARRRSQSAAARPSAQSARSARRSMGSSLRELEAERAQLSGLRRAER